MTRSILGVTFPFHFEQERGGEKIMSGATFVTGQWFVIVFMFLNPSIKFSLFCWKVLRSLLILSSASVQNFIQLVYNSSLDALQIFHFWFPRLVNFLLSEKIFSCRASFALEKDRKWLIRCGKNYFYLEQLSFFPGKDQR